jgi:hypothetical protein
VFVQRGAFRRRTPDAQHLLDDGRAYFAGSHSEEEFAHPTPGRDVSHAIAISP